MTNVRVRIAPSPTGPLHVGTARTALFNYLFAKKHGGKFVLRIEDTDLERSDPKFEKDIFEGLRWLGIDADENPEQGGPYGPYRQSERKEIHRKALEQLLSEKKIFYCPHPPQNEEEGRGVHWCSPEREPPGILRFATPRNQDVLIDDLIRGRVTFNTKTIGDFSIAKDLDTPLYNFAVAVDDYEMKITHVIRGEDLLPNTPKQLLLLDALGIAAPKYAHLPLILGPDRAKLSKRHGATSIGEYRDLGYLPEALVNFMALLGWNPGGERELFSMEELVREFSLEKVQKSGAVFDITKLDWMNGEYIRKLTPRELLERAKSFLPKHTKPTAYLEKLLSLEQSRLKKLSELPERVDYFFAPPQYEKELLRWKGMSDEEIGVSLDAAMKLLRTHAPKSQEESEKLFLGEIGAGDKGKLLWPLRVALTGREASPGPFEVMGVLGIEESLKRIQLAKEKLAPLQ